MKRAASIALFVSILLSIAVACDDPPPVGGPAPRPVAPAAAADGTPDPNAPAEPGSGGADGGVTELDYRDDDFLESDARRDPFRNYAAMFKTRAIAAPQREVIMPTTPVEEMRLIAIVSGVAQPRAMLLDANGIGFSVKRGDYVGRPEVVQAGSGADAVPVTLNWRVDRIRGSEPARGGVPARSSEVVLTREDPAAPGLPPLTRVIPLDIETTARSGTMTEATSESPPPR